LYVFALLSGVAFWIWQRNIVVGGWEEGAFRGEEEAGDGFEG